MGEHVYHTTGCILARVQNLLLKVLSYSCACLNPEFKPMIKTKMFNVLQEMLYSNKNFERAKDFK